MKSISEEELKHERLLDQVSDEPYLFVENYMKLERENTKMKDDYYRMNYIENTYSSGKHKEWHDFMSLVCDHGFRKAADKKRLSSQLPNA